MKRSFRCVNSRPSQQLSHRCRVQPTGLFTRFYFLSEPARAPFKTMACGSSKPSGQELSFRRRPHCVLSKHVMKYLLRRFSTDRRGLEVPFFRGLCVFPPPWALSTSPSCGSLAGQLAPADTAAFVCPQLFPCFQIIPRHRRDKRL